uniref:Putative cell adhesion molecule n=1 Tax=Anopheles darlingi TaxID=43151 RepID=A0A2M4DRW1_ANODA
MKLNMRIHCFILVLFAVSHTIAQREATSPDDNDELLDRLTTGKLRPQLTKNHNAEQSQTLPGTPQRKDDRKTTETEPRSSPITAQIMLALPARTATISRWCATTSTPRHLRSSTWTSHNH